MLSNKLLISIFTALFTISTGAFGMAVGIQEPIELPPPTGFLNPQETATLHQLATTPSNAGPGPTPITQTLSAVQHRILTNSSFRFIHFRAREIVNDKMEQYRRATPLNGYGSELQHPNPLMLRYLREIRGKKVADIGCATGASVAMAKLWGQPAEIFAIERSPDNLHALLHRFEPSNNADNRININNIHLALGEFPSDVKLEPNSFDAILFSNVIHYMTPEQIRDAFHNIAQALRPGGRVYIEALTTQEVRRDGITKYPVDDEAGSYGYNQWPFFQPKVRPSWVRHGQNLAILRRELAIVGLEPIMQGYFKYADTKGDLPWAWAELPKMDYSSEMVGIVAQKPGGN